MAYFIVCHFKWLFDYFQVILASTQVSFSSMINVFAE